MKKLKTFFDHVFVINLESSKDRKSSMKKSLKLMGIPSKKITFVKATDRTDKSWKKALQEIGYSRKRLGKFSNYSFLSKAYQKKVTGKRQKFWRGAIGNFLSHLRIWTMVGSMGSPGRFLILEDDICPTKFWFSNESTKLLKKVPDAQFIYLGDCYRERNKLKYRITVRNNELVRGPADCLHAYMITTAFGMTIKGALDVFFPLRDASDSFLKYFMEKYNIPWYNCKKALIVQKGDPSVIGAGTSYEQYYDKYGCVSQ